MDLHVQLSNAILLATRKHKYQVDKGGQPYILHPLHVMNNVDTLEEKIVAVLHDVIEDTDTTVDEIVLAGIDAKLAFDVLRLSRDKKEAYRQYLERIKSYNDSVVTNVKLADLDHNMDLSRLGYITTKDVDRFNKYVKVKKFLSE